MVRVPHENQRPSAPIFHPHFVLISRAGRRLPSPAEKTAPGRPSSFNEQMIEALCAVIRETGASDSGAAARVSLHPSTVSRWKRDYPDLAILLRSAREDFRQAQLAVIFQEAQAGKATSWRAAAWLLERIFPEDYAPRAAERAKFQERFEAVCAAEQEGGEIALPAEGEPLQNVQNSAAAASHREESPAEQSRIAPGNPLQNVQKAALAGPIRPPVVTSRTAAA